MSVINTPLLASNEHKRDTSVSFCEHLSSERQRAILPWVAPTELCAIQLTFLQTGRPGGAPVYVQRTAKCVLPCCAFLCRAIILGNPVAPLRLGDLARNPPCNSALPSRNPASFMYERQRIPLYPPRGSVSELRLVDFACGHIVLLTFWIVDAIKGSSDGLLIGG